MGGKSSKEIQLQQNIQQLKSQNKVSQTKNNELNNQIVQKNIAIAKIEIDKIQKLAAAQAKLDQQTEVKKIQQQMQKQKLEKQLQSQKNIYFTIGFALLCVSGVRVYAMRTTRYLAKIQYETVKLKLQHEQKMQSFEVQKFKLKLQFQQKMAELAKSKILIEETRKSGEKVLHETGNLLKEIKNFFIHAAQVIKSIYV